MKRPDAILFDLFGTLVSIDGRRLPRELVAGREQVTTIRGAAALLDRLQPTPTLDELYDALRSVSTAIDEEKRRRGHVEISSAERFGRALEALGVSGPLVEVAQAMSERHMASLADAVVCPGDRPALLASLAAEYRVGLISNFDHGPTARHVLERHRLAPLLDPIVVSDDVGVRKPGTAIFEIALERLGLAAQHCLYVGDSYDADVEGACAAGLAVVWVSEGEGDPGRAIGRIADVSQLPELLNAYDGRT